MRSPCPQPTPVDRDSPLVSPEPRRGGGSGDGDRAATAAATELVSVRSTARPDGRRCVRLEPARQAARFRPQDATESVAFALCPVFCAGVRDAVALRAAV